MPSTRDASGLHALAAATAARGEPETAAALFDAAVTASRLGAASGGPARPDLLCDAAVAWATLGDLGRAAVLLDQSLRLQPGHARALANRAALALVAGQHSSAEADARAALGQEEGLAVAHAALIGSLRAQGRELEASAAAAVSVELGLDSAGLRLQWAALATDAGDALAAREHLDAAARLAPGTSLSASR